MSSRLCFKQRVFSTKRDRGHKHVAYIVIHADKSFPLYEKSRSAVAFSSINFGECGRAQYHARKNLVHIYAEYFIFLLNQASHALRCQCRESCHCNTPMTMMKIGNAIILMSPCAPCAMKNG